jgi:hypothetical protein
VVGEVAVDGADEPVGGSSGRQSVSQLGRRWS